ncbi:hypothetical protein BDQ17DRAFT_1385091 [Cyathus striatus]|nr:hypothetical protein BDQ17DRAFT_1385091 [Cyathus striatus]
MANNIRSAKSASDWTNSDLDSYHITLNEKHALTFFGIQTLLQPSVHQEILNNTDVDDMQQDIHAMWLAHLENAMIINGSERAVDIFIIMHFMLMGYSCRKRVADVGMNLPLFICGERRNAEANVCIVDKTHNRGRQEVGDVEPGKAQAQLVAEAAENGLPHLEEVVIPGIVMVGTLPIFFKVPITRTLASHIRHGTYPLDETRVDTVIHPLIEGMKPLDNRRVIFQCYEAFKAIIGI